MSDAIEIRLADPSEYDVIGAITLRAYQHDDMIPDDSDYADDLRDAAARASGGELWVAARSGVVLGSVTFCPPGSSYRELASDGEGEFRMLAVEPTVRRSGAARALVHQCFDRCRELGLETMVICSLQMMRPAHALYRSFGFERDDSLDWEPVPGVTLVGFRATV